MLSTSSLNIFILHIPKMCCTVNPWRLSVTSSSNLTFLLFTHVLNFATNTPQVYTYASTWKHAIKVVCPCNRMRGIMLGALCPQPWPAGSLWCPSLSFLQPLNRPGGDKHLSSSSHNLSTAKGFLSVSVLPFDLEQVTLSPTKTSTGLAIGSSSLSVALLSWQNIIYLTPALRLPWAQSLGSLQHS